MKITDLNQLNLPAEDITKLEQGITLTREFEGRTAEIEEIESKVIKENGLLFNLDLVPESIQIVKAKFTLSQLKLQGTDFTQNVKNTGLLPLLKTQAHDFNLNISDIPMFSGVAQRIGLLRGEFPIKTSWESTGLMSIIQLLSYFLTGWVFAKWTIIISALGFSKSFSVRGWVPVKSVEYSWW